MKNLLRQIQLVGPSRPLKKNHFFETGLTEK